MTSRLLGLATLATLATASPAVAADSSRTDSAAIARGVRRAQRRFESLRHMNLPSGDDPGSQCDERIGRFCYWYDDADGESRGDNAFEEPERIRRGREVLLGTLANASARLPGDGWIAGQRVRYLVEAGRPDEAVEAARACKADSSWCDALAGFALHARGQYAAAESSYDAALRTMPREERCRWTDLSIVLEDDERRGYKKLDCDARGAFERRFWWLAQPLQSRSGNDLHSEYLSRWTYTRMQEHARGVEGFTEGDDLRELVLRYGWPRWHATARTSSILGAPGSVIGHDAGTTFDFRPAGHAVADPYAATAGDWNFRARRARMRYDPAYAANVEPLEHQLARFRRGDSMMVVAAYDVSNDTGFVASPAYGALVLSDAEGTQVTIARAPAGSRGPVSAGVPARDALLSIEVITDSAHRVARSRYAVHPLATGLSVSDLMIVNAGAGPTLAEALPHARGSERVRADERVGLFWEMYGLDPGGERVTISLAVRPDRDGTLRRIARSLGLARAAVPVSLQWEEQAVPREGVASRVVALNLSRLPPGHYHIALAIATGQRRVTAQQRRMQVTGR